MKNTVFIELAPFTMNQKFIFYTGTIKVVEKNYRTIEETIKAVWDYEKQFGQVKEIVFKSKVPGFSQFYVNKIKKEALTKFNRTDIEIKTI